MTDEPTRPSQRQIIERIIVRGNLILETPACLSNGDADGPTDMMLLRDSITPNALLTGASLAGALRNYLHEYVKGYEQKPDKDSLVTKLFGGIRQDEEGDQSSLLVNDSVSSGIPRVELRDGVKIDGETGTAVDKAKYDLEVLAAGTEFPLEFELLIDEDSDREGLLQSFCIVLQALENAEIGIGMKKSRGLGRCRVKQWFVWRFNLRQPEDMRAWLMLDRQCSSKPYDRSAHITTIFPDQTTTDRRSRFQIKATFRLLGSVIIRAGQEETGRAPDAVHLKSGDTPILSGTSITGVLRHRADRILATISNPACSVEELFGKVNEGYKQSKASRLIVEETVIENVNELIQNRIAIDRFTGGVYQGALFDERPIFATDETRLSLILKIKKPEKGEIGLLLLLLKDLWTGDLPIGGESSIGRGRLQGVEAQMKKYDPEQSPQIWTIEQKDGRLEISDASVLENFVRDLHNEETNLSKP